MRQTALMQAGTAASMTRQGGHYAGRRESLKGMGNAFARQDIRL